jgi:uncharacterized protein (TIGR03435 family)
MVIQDSERAGRMCATRNSHASHGKKSTNVRLVAACFFLVTSLTVAQARAQFEVAAIRPASFPGAEYFAGFVAGGGLCGPGRMQQAGSRVTFQRVTLCGLIRFAYEVKDYQVVEMPGWMNREDPSTFFDVEARTSGDTTAPLDQVREMVALLIRDRFQVSLHKERRDLPVYALSVTDDGLKLSGRVHERCRDLMKGAISVGPGTCFGMTMAQFALFLSRETDRAVVDQTGLTDRYGFSLEWSRARAPVDGQVSIFTAVQEQLGLKLVPRRMPVDAIVVDRAERPSPN